MDNTSQENLNCSTAQQSGKPYSSPQLISLGQIQAILQNGTTCGTDAGMGTTCAS